MMATCALRVSIGPNVSSAIGSPFEFQRKDAPDRLGFMLPMKVDPDHARDGAGVPCSVAGAARAPRRDGVANVPTKGPDEVAGLLRQGVVLLQLGRRECRG